MRSRILAALIVIPALWQAACSDASASLGVAGRKLDPGVPFDAVLDLSRSAYADFRLEVPSDTVCVRWKLVAQRAELDLSARRDEPVDSAHDLRDFTLATDGGLAQIVYDRFTEPAVGAGRFHARVEWPFEHHPRTTVGTLVRIPYTITAELIRARVDGELTPPAVVTGRIATESGSFRTYTIAVPEETRVLRFDLAEATGDLDLFVRRGGPILALEDGLQTARHLYGRETLIVQSADGGVLESGAWYVDVVDAFRDERPTAFRLHARFANDPPEELLVYPEFVLPPDSAPLARALAAVVEITLDDSNGSGTLLTRDGWILTAAHVVLDIGGKRPEEVVVALTLDPKLPSRELFRARVHDVDSERDLALLKITRGFYGQPLPEVLDLPTVAIDFDATPPIGAVLFLVGYPSTGGQGPRVSISATRGIVAGFETLEFGVILKTDAEITSGNSGGAALDERGRLVGVPTATIENGAGQIGYVHPVAGMRAEWRELIAPMLREK
ncbi:MAG: trypsin-like peptidase domain-containing protein [Planctomycetes bacterium]|nr:trypsin-like peptidase domain-containing protein [Planctomycetota bacterium]